MVEKVIWTQTAYSQKTSVLEYWNEKNGSSDFSIKLERSINNAIDLLIKFPYLGVKTQLPDVRVKVIKTNYLLIYRISETTLLSYSFGILDKTQMIWKD